MDQSYLIAFWSPFSFSAADYCMDFLSAFLKKHGDIQCLDCQNNSDSRTMRILHQADLVVIGLPQSYRKICDYFCRFAHHFSNFIYMIVNYFPDPETSLQRISHDFRVPPERISFIPFDSRYREASRIGTAGKYLQSLPMTSSFEFTSRLQTASFQSQDSSYVNLRRQLMLVGHLILKALNSF